MFGARVNRVAMTFAICSAALAPSASGERQEVTARAAAEPTAFGIRLRGPEAAELLRQATITEVEELQGGINKIWRVRLARAAWTGRAAFRTVLRHEMAGDWHFPDSYLSEIAAFEISQLLELPVVPATVAREIEGRPGSLQLWVEDAMTESQRRDRGLEPPDPEAFRRQLDTMDVFDNLIGNTDRHDGNMLIDADWRLWLIDHTRSFSRNGVLASPRPPRRCPRDLWLKLQSLGEQAVAARLGVYLGAAEIEALLARRELLLDQLAQRIDELSEEQVIFR